MLATDNELHPKEKAWFLAITKSHGASYAERSQLQDILTGKSPERLEEILEEIVDDFDKQRLLNLVRMAMRQDGIVKNSEIQLFYKIQSALEGSLRSDYQQLARSLVKRDKEIRVWRDLDFLGKAWSHRIPIFAISGHLFYVDGMLWESIFYLVERHKIKVLVVATLSIVLMCWVAQKVN